MTSTFDLEPTADHVAGIVASIGDDQLEAPTPCTEYTVGDLLDHVSGLSLAFTAAATKEKLGGDAQGPSGDASRLADDWRTSIPAQVRALAVAWGDAAAWTGMTQAGPIEMPGEIAGLVALNELVLHGWDLARASGQTYAPDARAVEAARDLVAQFSGPGTEEQRVGGFGPELEVPAGATTLDELLALSGRDPNWSAG